LNKTNNLHLIIILMYTAHLLQNVYVEQKNVKAI